MLEKAGEIRMKIKLLDKLFEAKFDEVNKSKLCIIYIPGASGKATERYDKLAKEFNNQWISFLRINLWEDEKKLGNLCVSTLHTLIDGITDFALMKGYKEIGLIGKSFGGGICLTYRNKNLSKLLLWAPAIGISEECNLNSIKNEQFSKIGSMKNVKINKNFLSDLRINVGIIHGTKDDVVSIENSKKLIQILPNARLIPISGADHSYREEPYATKLIEETIKFFKK